MVPSTILILDTETTGLDAATDRVVEVACIRYSLTHATVLRSYSSLIRGESNAAEAINRIPTAALMDAPEPARVWAAVASLADGADCVVAHNADFDRGFCAAAGVSMAYHIAQMPWVCSRSQMEWPRGKQGDSLVNLTLAHGLGVATAHRAMADCDMLARLFTRVAEMGVDLGAMVARGMRPSAVFVALAPYEQKDVVKAAGFSWDGERKEWRRRMAVEDVAGLPFRVREVGA